MTVPKDKDKSHEVKIEEIMSINVISLDVSKTASHAASLMTEKRIGSVIVTKNDKPFGIVTERDLLRRYFRNTLLEDLASHPLVTSEPSTTVEKAVNIMLKNNVRKLPVADGNGTLVGIVTETNLAVFLLPRTKSRLISLILRTVSRGKGPSCDSCNATTDIQWCDSCNRFMCLACEDQIHSVDLP